MTICFNHTIVAARDKRQSAEFLAELFGLPSPTPVGRFMAVALEHGANLDFADVPEGEEIRQQHYADPGRTRPGEINRNHGGRGVYFPDPSGHALEILTRPYGSDG